MEKKANQGRLWRKTAIAGMALCGVSLSADCRGAALEAIETPEGLVLERTVQVEETRQEQGREITRDPFNWSEILVERYRQKDRPTGDSIFKGLQLFAILWDKKMPLAIIDDTLLHEGDVIKGVTVRTIARDEVLLLHEKEHYTLRFSELLELESRRVQAGSK